MDLERALKKILVGSHVRNMANTLPQTKSLKGPCGCDVTLLLQLLFALLKISCVWGLWIRWNSTLLTLKGEKRRNDQITFTIKENNMEIFFCKIFYKSAFLNNITCVLIIKSVRFLILANLVSKYVLVQVLSLRLSWWKS